jgi:prolyl oligopeptidase
VIRILFLIMALVATSQCVLAQSPTAPPAARPTNETFFGTEVQDPYRWLEDAKSPEVAAWMKAQSDYTMSLLARIPGRQAMFVGVEGYQPMTAAK